MMRTVLILALATGSAIASQSASTVCVYNDAAFVLSWKLHDVATGKDLGSTNTYPVWKVRCIDIPADGTVAVNASLVPVVQAFWGKQETASDQVIYDPVMAQQVTYVCKGTTLDYSCKQGPSPPPIADVMKDVGEFALGFMDGMAIELGFAKCIQDINVTYNNTKAAIRLFEKGFNHITPAFIADAFKVVADVLKDFAAAIFDCYKEAESLVAQVTSLVSTLETGPLGIIKVIVDDAIHVWHDRKEISQDCKALVSDWRAADYLGSGKALGMITGELLSGLRYDNTVVV